MIQLSDIRFPTHSAPNIGGNLCTHSHKLPGIISVNQAFSSRNRLPYHLHPPSPPSLPTMVFVCANYRTHQPVSQYLSLQNISNVREFSAWRISGLSGVFLICVVTRLPTRGTVLHFRRLRWVFSPLSLPDRGWDSHCPLQMTLWTLSPEIKHSSNEADNSPS